MPADVLRVLLQAPRQAHRSIAELDVALTEAAGSFPLPVDQAILGGAIADRLGYAFAAGYAAALRRLVPGLAGRACFCVTEQTGAHPRAIRTTLDTVGRTITGSKAWSTLASSGDTLFVAVSAGTRGERNDIRLVRVGAAAPGVTLQRMPETPFTPEIPHFQVTFDATPVDDVLAGDGYEQYIKPFRTVEDTHVCASAVAYLVGVNRGWAPSLLTSLVALRSLALADPTDPAIHVSLDACIKSMQAAIAALDWTDVDPVVAARWTRDAPLLQVASRAREARTTAALKKLGGGWSRDTGSL